jgi:hypothetical protein
MAAIVLLHLLGSPPVDSAPPSLPTRLGFVAGDDWEPSIAADRFGHVYAFWNHYTPLGGASDPSCPACPSPHMELQISSDGGQTWSPPRALLPDATDRQDDPQIVVDPVDGRTVYTGFMMGDKASMFVAKSTDFGQTWVPVLVEDLQRGTDKCILAVRGQEVYLVYNAVMKIYASVSHDGGTTWSFGKVVSNTNSKLGWSLPSGGAIDTHGNAYFAWAGYEANGKPSGEVNLFVSRSTDGGENWTVQRVAVSGAPPSCGTSCGWAYWGAQMALAVDGRDRVYVLYNASASKFAVSRMNFARSDDRGVTWNRQEVSLAPVGTNNLFPAIAARANGDVRIAWQDDRNGFDAGNDDPNARWNTYYRVSSDGGASWSGESQLSRMVEGYGYKRSDPRDGYLEPYGDYFEIDIDGSGRSHLIWGEGPSYQGPGNVWYTNR